MHEISFDEEGVNETEFTVKILEHSKKTLIFGLYSQLNRFENHLDTITSRFKNVTLSWFFAIYAAIGFLFSSNSKTLPFDHLIAVIVICIIGVIAITLIWNLDLNVYHRFWAAVYVAENKMEVTYNFLLASRSIELLIDDRKQILSQANIYMFTNALLIITMCFATLLLLGFSNVILVLFVILFFTAVLFLLLMIMIATSRYVQKGFNHAIKSNHQ